MITGLKKGEIFLARVERQMFFSAKDNVFSLSSFQLSWICLIAAYLNLNTP